MLYFQKVKEGIHSEDSQIRETIYNSLRRDRGFHQLLPYLIQYIISEVWSFLSDGDAVDENGNQIEA